MADYSNDREQKYEVKYLRKVLGQVDERIRVPESVRGAALREKLDNVYPTVPAAPDKKSGAAFGLRWLGWQSGLTYAAAFALIVGIFYGMGFNNQPAPEILQRNVELPAAVEFGGARDAVSAQDAPVPESAAEPETLESMDQAAPEAFSQPSADAESEASAGSLPGIGGGGMSQLLGTRNGYAYTWRMNDATDPDKGAFPVTVDILSELDAQLASQIDIPDMAGITKGFFSDGVFTVVGEGEAVTVTRCYDITDPQAVMELAVATQPGSFVDSRVYDGFVHTVSYCEDETRLPDAAEALPYALHGNACVVGATDTRTGQSALKAFTGADNEIALHNLSAYIHYQGLPEDAPESAGEDAQEPALHVAQILLDGLNISVSSVS